jgi:tryptophan-rich sensory protein
MGVAAWLVSQRDETRQARLALGLFVLQLVVNALWSWLFFAWMQGAWSFFDIVLLWALIVATLVCFGRIRPLAGWLLAPYLAWVTFAAALNYRLWQLNPAMLE